MNNKKLIIGIILVILIVIIFSFINYFSNRINEIAAVNLYKEIIDLTVLENKGLTNDAEYISLDINTLVDPLSSKRLSDNSINEIVSYCKKHNEKVLKKGYEQLISEGLGDSTKLKGVLISINLRSKSFNTAIITSKIYSGNLGSSMVSYKIKYNGNSWSYSENGEKVQS